MCCRVESASRAAALAQARPAASAAAAAAATAAAAVAATAASPALPPPHPPACLAQAAPGLPPPHCTSVAGTPLNMTLTITNSMLLPTDPRYSLMATADRTTLGDAALNLWGGTPTPIASLLKVARLRNFQLV